MYIEIETEKLTTQPIKAKATGIDYYSVEQPALMFTENSRYPVQFNIRHVFTDKEHEAKSCQPLLKGRYVLTDDAYKIDRFKNISLEVKAVALKQLAKSTAVPSIQQAA